MTELRFLGDGWQAVELIIYNEVKKGLLRQWETSWKQNDILFAPYSKVTLQLTKTIISLQQKPVQYSIFGHSRVIFISG